MTDDNRKRLKAHYAECERVRAAREAIERANHKRWMRAHGRVRATLQPIPLPDYPPFPDDLSGLACVAKTRAGTPCKMTSIYSNGRCKLHGGLSTGPRSKAGKARAALNGLTPKKRTP